MKENYNLNCPVRGVLKTNGKSSDGLTPNEEFFRVEAIKFLIEKGYPKENFVIEPVVKRFGNNARNSMRADFAVLDITAKIINKKNVDELMDHAVLICEVKRDNSNFDYVKNTQVKPLLEFAKLKNCTALYWDSTEQIIFWNEIGDSKREIKEGPINFLSNFGEKIKVKKLTLASIRPSEDLIDIFSRIENIIHSASIDLNERYSVMLKLILGKLFDENSNLTNQNRSLTIQDFKSIGLNPNQAKSILSDLIEKSIDYYSKHLPKPVSKEIPEKLSGENILEISRILAPVKLTGSKREVIQTFYMKFAKDLYKWDLAQYFTPPLVTDFIVEILNLQFGDHIRDPACGSADFLTAAFHLGRNFDVDYSNCIWGADKSDNAVHVAVLNMLLNGDGKSNIKEEDSLKSIDKYQNQFNVVVCNPPFGVNILETDKEVLAKFELGREWKKNEKGLLEASDIVKEKQQIGILFLEACVLQAKPGGRIGIILPNGYLGNRSPQYVLLRRWLLKHCRLVSICSFPRFTFKNSGADVSASVVYLEKRNTPLKHIEEDINYDFSVEMIENVGWVLGDNKQKPLHKRDDSDGSYFIGDDGLRIIQEDFTYTVRKIRNSSVVSYFPWISKGKTVIDCEEGWSRNISYVIDDPYLTIDPKRHCKKFVQIREKILKNDYLKLEDFLEVLPEKRNSSGEIVSLNKVEKYNYVEIQNINKGDYASTLLRGWELPSRAKHLSEPGDIYIGSVWGSVSKWFIASETITNTVVTNGCHRLRIRKGKEHYLNDLIAYICTEGFSIQMRGLARGSDGLAEVSKEDIYTVVIPRLNQEERDSVQFLKEDLLKGTPSVISKIDSLINLGKIKISNPKTRSSHVILV